MIKCIVCDLDGTLIRFDDTIEERTYKILKDCMNNGIEFIIATGRDINMVIDVLDDYHLDCDLILNNGAQYCNRHQTLNEIYPMDNDAFIKIATILNDYGYLLAIHTDNGKYSFMDKEAFWDYHYELLTKSHNDKLPKKTFTTREGYLRDLHFAANAKEIIDKGIKVLKIDARHKDAYSIKGVREQLNIDHLDISSSYEDNIEITSDASNKGLLLEKVIKRKGYQKDEVAVFGDGENDAPMLKSFSYSFAPKNASKHALKAAAYNLRTTCEEGTVYEGLQILKEKKLI
ncbi:MAG: Cof-type HAD-IIB family hydrolase [Erysipelotrichaceae bacterium]|nr:Cof-type HAD-IIB family hydrolase [Erysipelotrichaceae bacterium]